MQTSPFFNKKPTGLMRFKIDQITKEFHGGMHRSMLTGKGIEFKRLRPYNPLVDTPTSVDDMASHRLSDEPEIEPYSRVHNVLRRISTLVLLDSGVTMRIPEAKEELASFIFWFTALSAFKQGDYFRVITYDLMPFGDSGTVSSEGELIDFFIRHSKPTELSKRFSKFRSVYSYLSHCDLHDTLVFVISDFTFKWDEELSLLRSVGTRERNIKLIFFALDEWEEFSSSSYSMAIYDPRLGKVREFCQEELRELKIRASAHLLSVEESVRPISSLFIRIPILSDPAVIVKRALRRIGFS